MTHDIAPAIRTELDERYNDMELIDRIGSDTRFHRGLGDIGTIVELVDMSRTSPGGCPRCGEAEMVVSRDVGPESQHGAFWCTNLKCPHFVADEVEYDMDKIRASRPEQWDNTAKCPRCDKRFTTQLRKGMHENHEYVEGNAEDGGIVGDVVCDDCTPSLDESELSSIREAKEEL